MKNIILISVFLLVIPFIAKGAVVINEIAWMGTVVDYNDEWIELYNSDSQAVDLTDWILETTDGTPKINLSGSITANGYFLLERTDDNSVPNITADQIYTGALGNSGEYLKLKNSSGNVVDEVNCSDDWLAGDNSTKQTMEKVSSGWQTSSNPGGTPKAQNSSGATEEPEDEPEGPSTPLPSSSSNQPPIADAGSDIIAFADQEITFDGSKSYDPDGLDLAYEWNLGEGGVKSDIIVTHKYSYPGTYLVTLMVFDGRYYVKDTITVEIYPKKITINEFLPSPKGKDAEEEWIELYNDSDQIIDISGWQLDDEDGGSKPFTFPKNTLIAPNSYPVFTRQTTGISLNNDNDKVRLLLSTGVIFQEISYEKAPEGKSSARTPEGFVWSIPTPGLPNIIGPSQEQNTEQNKPLETFNAGDSSENMVLYHENNSENSIKGGWTQLSQSKTGEDNARQYYNLANLNESTGSSSKPILIILTIAVIVSAVVIGALKLKKKI